jgi:RNA polymerase sigma factor (sigma-70 family)
VDILNKHIREAQKGNHQSFTWLYQQFSHKLYGILARYTSSLEDAQDILQETFIRLFQQIGQYRFEGSFEGWLKRIAVNIALEQYRKQSVLKHSIDIEHINESFDEPQSTEEILSNINTNELLTIVQELPPTYRMVFNLYVFEDMKHREIAEQLHISEGTSKSNLSDARRFLAKRLKAKMIDRFL